MRKHLRKTGVAEGGEARGKRGRKGKLPHGRCKRDQGRPCKKRLRFGKGNVNLKEQEEKKALCIQHEPNGAQGTWKKKITRIV